MGRTLLTKCKPNWLALWHWSKLEHHAILTATESLVNSRVELAMQSVNACSGEVDSVVPDLDEENVFKEKSKAFRLPPQVEYFQTPTQKRLVLTRGITTIEKGDLLVFEKNFDWQIYIHCSKTFEY